MKLDIDMIFGMSSFALNAYLVKNMISNIKNRVRLKSRQGEDVAVLLEDLTLALAVKDDSENLKVLLPQLLAQKSKPAEILFLNDQSQDKTLNRLQSFQQFFLNTTILEGSPTPEGYSAKVWALQQLLEHVKTKYVLFLDANVRLPHPHSLCSLYNETEVLRAGHYSFASVFPKPTAAKGANLLVNQVFVQLYYVLPAKWKDSRDKSLSAGCEQVMFINVEKLRAYNFLEYIASSKHYGLQLARLFKAKDGKVNFFDGGQFFQSPYYNSLQEALKGFSQKYNEENSSVFSSTLMAVVFFWAFVLPFILIPFCLLNPWWLASLLLILWGQIRLAEELNFNSDFVWATPAAATVSAALHVWSGLKNTLHFKEFWPKQIA